LLIKNLFENIKLKIMGIGDWGLGIGDWGLGPIRNRESPLPNPPTLNFKYKKK